jgi:hypothetical protein
VNGTASRKLVLPVILGILVVLAWVGTAGSPLREHSLDASAQLYADDGLKRALATFAVARGINALLSAAQGTSLVVEPLGVGAQVSVGQAVHPLNQVVGQFAESMLAASVAFGVMEVLTRMASTWPLTIALTLAAAGWAVFWWRRSPPPPWLAKVLLILMVLRFAVPAASLSSQWAYSAFLADDYAKSQKEISASEDVITGIMSTLSPSQIAETKHEPGRLVKIKSAVTSLITELTNGAKALTRHMVKLMGAFLLETLAIPLLFFWILMKGCRLLLNSTVIR